LSAVIWIWTLTFVSNHLSFIYLTCKLNVKKVKLTRKNSKEC
jgi:hypothetical protein